MHAFLDKLGVFEVLTYFDNYCIFSESSDEDEYAGMSEYEKEREKRIKRNKQVLDGLMKDIKKPVTKLSVRTPMYYKQLYHMSPSL